MKFLFLFIGAWLLTIPAEAQRRLRSHLPIDSTKDFHPYENISYNRGKGANGRQQLIFTLTRSTVPKFRDFPSRLDSVKLVSTKDTLTLYHPKPDTSCVDAIGVILEEYCHWMFTFALEEHQQIFLRQHEINAIVFYDWDQTRTVRLTEERKQIFKEMTKD